MHTECPKCQSIFMVSEQDLTAHEGLVRCGNCYSVFNAGANLTDDPQESDVTAPPPDVSARPVDLPTGASTVSTSSDFTFNFVEEVAEETSEAASEEASPEENSEEQSEADGVDAPPQDDEMDPFPEPDFTGEALDKPEAAPASTKEDDSLLYFGPDHVEEQTPEPEASHIEADPVDSSLLQANVFNPATSNEADQTADEPTAVEDDAPADDPAEEDEKPYTGPEISEQDEDTGSDFAMPDFSPLEGLEPGSVPIDSTTADSTEDDEQDGVSEIEHLETNFDEESLWPDEEDAQQEQAPSLPSSAASQRFLEDETHDALQAYEDKIPDMGLETPGMASEDDLPSIASDEPEDIDASTDPLADIVPDAENIEPEVETEAELEPEPRPEPDFEDFDQADSGEAESVFITSDEDESDEAYQAMNVKDDKAYHDNLDGDFPLPDEIEGFDENDNPDIDKLLQQSADGQSEIDAKLAEAGIKEPEMGTPDIDDDSEESPALEPAAAQTEADSAGSSGLMHKVSAGIGYIADRLHFGRRSYHGLDTYETQEHQDTLLVRQLEHEGHGSLFGFISPGMQRALLMLTNAALVILLLFQTGKYFMDDLAQVSVLRPVLVAGCQLAGCRVPQASNPAAIEQLSSKMTVLDGQQDGMRIAVTLINRDNAEQPFPALELSLTDRGGRIISRQVVMAEQYRGKSAEYTFMQPGQAEDINILLRTPAVRVDGFELRPVKLHWLDPRLNN